MENRLFHGKDVASEKWIEGYLVGQHHIGTWLLSNPVIPESIGEFSRCTDKNGRMIFEGHIVEFKESIIPCTCRAVVKFGEYMQDGSTGEYPASNCMGFYIEVMNVTATNELYDATQYPKHLMQQNILAVAKNCQVVGYAFDSCPISEDSSRSIDKKEDQNVLFSRERFLAALECDNHPYYRYTVGEIMCALEAAQVTKPNSVSVCRGKIPSAEENALRECPFCKEQQMIQVEAVDHGPEKRPNGYRWTANVVCLKCFASCGTHGFHDTEDHAKANAIQSWNNRATCIAEWNIDRWRSGYIRQVTCSKCGGSPRNTDLLDKYCNSCGCLMRNGGMSIPNPEGRDSRVASLAELTPNIDEGGAEE